MNFQGLLLRVAETPLFTTSYLLAGQTSPEGVRRQLDRWVKAGKVLMLRRGVYAVAAPYHQARPHPFVVANALRRGSYVSLQSALAFYGMIPEHTPVTTSVTTGRPEQLNNAVGRFIFRHVKGALFRGFIEREVAPGQRALIATPEKALVDLLHLTPGSDAPAYLEELRATPVPQLDIARLREMAERSASRKVQRAVERLCGLWQHESEYVAL